MPTWNDEEGRIVVRIYSSDGGIKERTRSWAIDDTSTSYNSGWTSSIKGQRQRRGGIKSYGVTSLIGPPLQPRPLGMLVARDTLSWRYLSGQSNIESGAVVAIALDEGLNDAVVFVTLQANGYRYVHALAGPTGYDMNGLCDKYFTEGVVVAPSGIPKLGSCLAVCDAYPHPTLATGTSGMFLRYGFKDKSPTSPLWFNGEDEYADYRSIRPTSLCFFQGRLWVSCDYALLATGASGAVLGFSSSASLLAGSDLRPSGLYDILDWSHPVLYIEPGLGGRNVAVRPYRAEDGAMIVFKQGAICLFYPKWGSGSGYMSIDTDMIDATESRVVVLNSQIGCLASRSIVEIPSDNGSDFMFLASDGHIRRLSRSANDQPAGAGRPVTYEIPDTMKRISVDWVKKANATFWDNKYILAVPLDGETYCNHLIIINTLTDAVESIEPFDAAQVGSIDGWEGQGAYPKLLVACGAETTDTTPTGYSVGMHLFSLFQNDSEVDPDSTTIMAREDGPMLFSETISRKKRWDRFSAMVEASTLATSYLAVSYALSDGQFSHLATLVFPKFISGRRMIQKSAGLSDIAPDYFIQFRIESADLSRATIVYSECVATVIRDEFDNDIT